MKLAQKVYLKAVPTIAANIFRKNDVVSDFSSWGFDLDLDIFDSERILNVSFSRSVPRVEGFFRRSVAYVAPKIASRIQVAGAPLYKYINI